MRTSMVLVDTLNVVRTIMDRFWADDCIVGLLGCEIVSDIRVQIGLGETLSEEGDPS
ncbi:MAG: hypothetical protein AAGB46_02205 [Verrucomicrobiota bacterium]